MHTLKKYIYEQLQTKQNKHEMQSPFIELGHSHPQCVLRRYSLSEQMLSISLKSFCQFCDRKVECTSCGFAVVASEWSINTSQVELSHGSSNRGGCSSWQVTRRPFWGSSGSSWRTKHHQALAAQTCRASTGLSGPSRAHLTQLSQWCCCGSHWCNTCYPGLNSQ